MASNYRPVVAQPKLGGALMSNVSSEEAGVFNYVVKRDFRRLMDSEKRREGYDYLWPNVDGVFLTDPLNQPFPNNVTARPLPYQLAATMTRTGTTATMTFPSGHIFVEGETIAVSGANQPGYNGTFVISNVTRTTFDYTVPVGTVTPATGTLSAKSAMPINLGHLARRPNGKTAIIVGTAVRLFRYYALDNGDYISTDPADYPAGQTPEYWSTNPADYPVGQDPQYVDSNPGDWIIIGDGFALDGQRWEAVSINGWSVFNNGVDLPVTYRVEDIAVVPIWEMREQGIAAVGTIAELNGILMVADISEIFEDQVVELFALDGERLGGDVLASQVGTVVTVNSNFFAADGSDIGKYLIYENDAADTTQIVAPYISETQANVATAFVRDDLRFRLRTKFSQTGNQFSGTITASQGVASDLVNASAPIFDAGMVNKDLRYTNGWSARIIAFNSNVQVQVATVAPPLSDFTSLPFYISDGATGTPTAYADYFLTASAPVFTTEMVGRTLILDNGIARRIDAFVSSTQVQVDSDMAIASVYGGVERPETYGRYSQTQFINRIQYRVAWAMPDLPRRWGALVFGTMTEGSNILTLRYPVRSFEAGQEIIVVGAGTDGGNLSGPLVNDVATPLTIIYSAGGLVLTLSSPAITSTTEAGLEQADVLGSIIGFEDLQDDSSGIIRMMELQGTIVIYKDTAIFLGNYTGDPETPFVFKLRRVSSGATIFYRYTLVAINTAFHVFAGRNAFYRFDLTNQVPQEIALSQFCHDIFFDQATLANTNDIWAADNTITKEVFLVFPTTDVVAPVDRMLAFDYLFQTFSTSSMAITAGATVKRPETGISIGETENWFVMGTAAGTILLYGLADQIVDAWGAKEIIYRRDTNPFTATKSSYDSNLKPGMTNFADPVNEKDIRSYFLILSSHSPNGAIAMKFYGTRNTAETPTLLASYTILSPTTQNLVPVHFRRGYFQEEITISGQDNPLQIFQRIWDMSPVMTAGTGRRPT